MRRAAMGIGLAVAACSAPPPPPPVVVPAPTIIAPPPAPLPAVPEFEVATLPVYRHVDPVTRVGDWGSFTARGVRLSPDGRAAPGTLPAAPKLIATWPGEGVVFATPRAVWLAPSFLEKPKGLIGLMSQHRQAIFARGRTLMVLGGSVDLASGSTWRPPLPVGATHQVIVDDKLRAAVFFGGTVATSADGGATWKPGPVVPKKHLSAYARALEGWLAGQPGVTKLAQPKLQRATHTPPIDWARLDAVDRHRVLVPQHPPQLWDARTGVATDLPSPHDEPPGPCEARAVHGATLLVCPHTDQHVTVHAFDGAQGWREERVGPVGARVFAAGARLAMTGACDGNDDEAACVRGHDGRWRTVRHDHLRGHAVIRAVPFADDDAVLITGHGLSWSIDRSRVVVLRPAVQRALEPHGDRVIDDAWEKSAEPSLRGWAKAMRVGVPARLAADGALEKIRKLSRSLRWSGARAIDRRSGGDMVQSLDFGATWQKVGRPPGRFWHVRRCGPLGCDLGPWQRIGWRSKATASGRPLYPPAGPQMTSVRSKAALQCTAQPGRSRAWKPARVGIHTPVERVTAGVMERTYQWLDPFDARGRSRTAVLRDAAETSSPWLAALGRDARGAAQPYVVRDCAFAHAVGSRFRIARMKPANGARCPRMRDAVRMRGTWQLLGLPRDAPWRPSTWKVRGDRLERAAIHPFIASHKQRFATEGSKAKIVRLVGFDDWALLSKPPVLPTTLPRGDKLVPASDPRCRRSGPRMELDVLGWLPVRLGGRESRRNTSVLVRFSGGLRCVEAASVGLDGESHLVVRFAPRREATLFDPDAKRATPHDCTWVHPPPGKP